MPWSLIQSRASTSDALEPSQTSSFNKSDHYFGFQFFIKCVTGHIAMSLAVMAF
jgi:hypothetical protein